MSKASYHHGDLKNALLDAADELLAEEGLQGFTLRACARKAGVSHAAPKHHFNDVRGLLTAVAERGFQRLVDILVEELKAAKGDLEEEMHATATAYIRFAEGFPEHFRVMFRDDLLQTDRTNPPCSVIDTFTELTNVILRQRGEPEIAPGGADYVNNPDLVNDIILGWTFIHGYAHLKLEGQMAIVPEEMHAGQIRRAAVRLSRLIGSRADTAA